MASSPQIGVRIKTKLLLSFAAVSLITLAAGVSNILPMRYLEQSIRHIGPDNLQALMRISAIRTAQSQVLISERTLLIRQLLDHKIRTSNYELIQKAYETASTAADGFESFLVTPKQIEIWKSIREAWDIWEKKQNELLDILRKQDAMLLEGVSGGRQFDRIANQAFDLAFSELQDFREKAFNQLDDLVELIQSNAIEAVADSLAQTHANLNRQIFFIIAAFIVSLGLGIWLSERISRPVLQAVQHLTKVADGNLRLNVEAKILAHKDETGLLANAIQKLIESQRHEVGVFKSIADGNYTCSFQTRSEQDELGQAVSQMINITTETLAQVNQAVAEVTSRAGAIDNASQAMSQGAVETAASLEEIFASITQIGAKTKANAASAGEADKLAASSRTAIDKGYETVAKLITAMRDIQVTSTQIASVVKLIDDIAFQTNLLALNAAVEAARAGRHGRGFSIVADEVRSLAGRSAKAAKDTAQMLEQTTAKLENGAGLAEHTDSVLRKIVENAAQVAELFREIATSSNEQSLGISQIASGLSQIDQVSQHNTITAGETASSAKSLLAQAEGLRIMMERFRLRSDGNAREVLMRRNWPGAPADNFDPGSADAQNHGGGIIWRKPSSGTSIGKL